MLADENEDSGVTYGQWERPADSAMTRPADSGRVPMGAARVHVA